MANIFNKRLLSFSFSNFLSFKNEQTIFFTEESKYSSDSGLSSYSIPNQTERTLPVTVIYGANASGKTNALVALKSFSRLFDRADKKARDFYFYKPFKLDDEREKETSCGIEFLLGDNCYSYEISFDKNSFLKEELQKNDKTLYKKVKNNDIIIFNDTSISEHDKEYINDLIKKRKDITILELLTVRGIDQYVQLYSFLKTFDEDDNEKDSSFLEPLYNDKEEKRKVLEWLKFADIGISNIKINKETQNEDELKKRKILMKKLEEVFSEIGHFENSHEEDSHKDIYKVSFEHKGKNGKDYLLAGVLESSGTKKFFEKMIVFSVAFSKGGIFLFDEFENNFHPLLVKFIIDAFHNKEINKAGAQIIFSTHDVNLLKPDILRRDEIWFSEKDCEGKSELYPLSKFKDIRNTMDYRKGYLAGRFGAIPYMGNIKDLIRVLEK